MTTPNVAAQVLVRACLNGRHMDPTMFAAVVWMAEKRIGEGCFPVVDQQLRDDIDSQAGASVAQRISWPRTPFGTVTAQASSSGWA